jgi:hypothetical protein
MTEPGSDFGLVLENNCENYTDPKEVLFDMSGITTGQDQAGRTQLYDESDRCLEYSAHLNQESKWYIDVLGLQDYPHSKRFKQIN